MADFLTKLASRAMGLAPMVEPVVASMFAPEPTAATAIGSDEALDDSRHLLEPAPDRDAPRLPSASLPETADRLSAPRRRQEPTQAASAPAHSVSEPNQRPAQAEPDEIVVSIPAAENARLLPLAGPSPRALPVGSSARDTATAEPDETVVSVPAAEDARLLPSSGPSPRTLPVESSARDAATQPTQPAQSDLHPAPAAWPEEPDGAPERPSARPRRGVSASWDERVDAPLLMPLAPAEAPSSKRRDAPAGRAQPIAAGTPADEVASPPTIEITIGRVEVRAVHPPAPPARPKPAGPPAPALSLEEYLRNQYGGRR